jgi:hypothetical protein
MFLFDDERAEQQFHYRTVMINWLFTPNMTYQDLAVKSMELWNTYLDNESVKGWGSKDPSESWGTWCVTRHREGMRAGFIWMLCTAVLKLTFHLSRRRDQIKVAMDYLTSPELADKQVQFIVET